MDKSQLKALINLLEDPDERVHSVASRNLIEGGTSVVNDLINASQRSPDKNLIARIERIIRAIHLRSVRKRLGTWLNSIKQDLLYGAFLVESYKYPALRYSVIKKKYQQILRDIEEEMNPYLTPLEKIRVINHVLFTLHGMNHSKLNVPNDSLINSALETKRGNSTILGIIYFSVAKHCGLPVCGINLPKNFLLGYLDEENELQFFINPASKGLVLGFAEINYFLFQINFPPREHYFLPCSYNDMIERLILNMVDSYHQNNDNSKIGELQHLHDLFQER